MILEAECEGNPPDAEVIAARALETRLGAWRERCD
jgi:hypothetical protein